MGESKLNRAHVLEWFGGSKEFEDFHQGMVDETVIAALIDEDLT